MIEILPPSTCHMVAHFLHVDLYFQRFMGCFFLIFKNYFDLSIHYLFLAVLGLCCCAGFTLVVESGGCSLVAVHGLLTAVASLVLEHEPEHRLSSCGPWAQLLLGMWNLPGSGIKPESPALAGRFFTTEPPGKSSKVYVLLITGIQLYCGNLTAGNAMTHPFHH